MSENVVHLEGDVDATLRTLSGEIFALQETVKRVTDRLRAREQQLTDTASCIESRRETLESALRAIRGPEDQGRWIEIYRAHGGGYEGLQAIAEAALDEGRSTT